MVEQLDYDKLGLVSYKKLEILATTRQPYLISNFILKPSINLMAGDSGLGKSALCAQIALCVAANKPFFGHEIEDPGTVIYCDAESQPATMRPMIRALSNHLGLDDVPDNFLLWNPNWNMHDREIVITQNKNKLYSLVDKVKPRLVVLDSLRNYFPFAIKEQEHAATMIKEMRRYSAQTGCCWVIIHHLRKKNKDERANNSRPTVKHDIHLWLEEAAGSLALINNTDLRLGWEKDPGVNSEALWLGGFLRVFGEVGPYKVVRILDDEGEPVGYRMATPTEQLTAGENEIYALLPKTNFTFKHLVNEMGKSQGASSRFIRRALDLGLVSVDRELAPNKHGGRPTKVYVKVLEEDLPR